MDEASRAITSHRQESAITRSTVPDPGAADRVLPELEQCQ